MAGVNGLYETMSPSVKLHGYFRLVRGQMFCANVSQIISSFDEFITMLFAWVYKREGEKTVCG